MYYEYIPMSRHPHDVIKFEAQLAQAEKELNEILDEYPEIFV